MDVPVFVDQDAPVDRIKSYLTNFYSIYYSIFKTETMLRTFKEIKKVDFSELGIVELFLSYMQLAQGKVHRIGAVTYIRQRGSSQAAASQRDWFYRLFHTNWLEDLKRALEYIAEYIGSSDKESYKDIYGTLYEDFIARHRLRFSCQKNSTIYKSRHILRSILLQKVFRISPVVGEYLGVYYLKKFTSSHNLSAIKEVILRGTYKNLPAKAGSGL
jgi:hypothetical protein